MKDHDESTIIEQLQGLVLALDEHAIVSMADAAGNINFVNQKFCEISGYTMEELLGRNHRIVKSCDHPAEFYQAMWETIARGQVWRGQVKNRGKDGRAYWVETTIVPLLGEDDLPEKYVSVRTDITRLKALEEKILEANANLQERVRQRTVALEEATRQLEEELTQHRLDQAALQESYGKLQALNRQLGETQAHLLHNEKLAAIGQLAGGIAHEINNPIGFIYANLGTLGRYIEETFDLIGIMWHQLATVSHEAQHPIARAACQDAHQEMLAGCNEMDLDFLRQDSRALLSESVEGISRIRKVVENLRNFAQVDSDTGWQRTDVHACLESALNLVPATLLEGIEVSQSYGILPEILCHPANLNQVFFNLIINALQAMAGHGLLSLQSGAGEDSIWVEVGDSGPGISAEVLPHIFDPFFTTQEIGGGMGLGLSMAHGIVNQHGGQIDIHSVPGQGATVRIKLPLQPVIHGRDTAESDLLFE
jgi:PAS domain S-box-containing protein